MKGVEQPMIIKKNVIQLKVFPVLLATTEKPFEYKKKTGENLRKENKYKIERDGLTVPNVSYKDVMKLEL